MLAKKARLWRVRPSTLAKDLRAFAFDLAADTQYQAYLEWRAEFIAPLEMAKRIAAQMQ